jgi:phosphatidyl-myo-inositol dimannoside synthase
VGLAAGGARDALADGALGTLVAEPELGSAVHRLLSGIRRDPEALAHGTRTRFGREPFRRRVEAVLARLIEPQSMAA